MVYVRGGGAGSDVGPAAPPMPVPVPDPATEVVVTSLTSRVTGGGTFADSSCMIEHDASAVPMTTATTVARRARRRCFGAPGTRRLVIDIRSKRTAIIARSVTPCGCPHIR